MKLNNTKLCLIGLAMLGVPLLAFAGGVITTEGLQDAANGAAHPTLSAISMAEKLFGDIALNPMAMVGTPNTILGEVMAVINLVLMAMGSVWVTWSILSGSMMTAQEGVFLGRRMHSAWIPLRLTFGAASLIPFFKGLCLSQLIMLWAIQLAIGGGNMVWAKGVDWISTGGSIVSPIRFVESENITKSLLDAHLCVDSLNFGLLKNGFPASYGYQMVNTDTGRAARFGSNKGAAAECGQFDMPVEGTDYLTRSNGELKSAKFIELSAKVKVIADNLSGAVITAVMNPAEAATFPAYPTNKVREASFWYNDQLKSTNAALINIANTNTDKGLMLSQLKADAKEQGFATAGAWFFTLSSKNSAADSAIKPNVIISKQPQSPESSVFVGANDIYQITTKIVNASHAKENDKYDPSAGDGGMWTKFMQYAGLCETIAGKCSLGQTIVKDMTQAGSEDQNALIRISEMGNVITGTGAAMFTGAGAVEGAMDGANESFAGWLANKSGAGVAIGAIKGAAEQWADMAASGGFTLFIFGLICAVYIPMIPAIIWVMRMISIIAVWVEAVVSAPMWAFAHFDTEGEGLGQRTQHGYLFLLNVLLNPMLSVVGLLLAVVALDIFSTFFLTLYPTIIANASADSWTGLLKIVAYLIAFVVVNLGIVNICMQLINVVPDNILAWVGGQMQQALGRNGEDAVSSAVKDALDIADD